MQNKNYSTKSVVEAGLLAALIVVIALLNAYLPLFSTIGTLILPIPVTMLYLRHKFKITLSAVVVSGILVAVLYNPISGLMGMVIYGLNGIGLGYCIEKDKKFLVTLIYTTITACIGIVINFYVISNIIYPGGIMHLIQTYIDQMKQGLDVVKGMYLQMGVPKESISSVFAPFYSVLEIRFFLLLIPISVVGGAVISAYLNYIITRAVLVKLKYNVKESNLTPFSEIYMNAKFALIIVLIALVGIILNRYQIGIGQYILFYSQLIFYISFAFIGAATAAYFLKYKFNLPKVAVVLIILFTLFNVATGQIYVFLGLADMLLDFRKINPNRISFKR